MKFCWSTIRVSNMEVSLAFYQEIVGLRLTRRLESRPGVEIAFLGDGETQVELVSYKENQEVNLGQDISLGFLVESVDEMMKFAEEKGLAIHSGPFQPNKHIKFFYVLDPDGLKIQFVETH
ncbi:MAG: VOC family protein [Gorillibacterium sp.]|nr:VOC family protein [Gorillibacterium sp.]